MSHNLWIDLIRHGITERNKQPGIVGQSPEEPLAIEGKEQAEKLKDYFAKKNIKHDAIFCSPYLRAQQTCNILFPDRQSEIKTVDEIREINQGDGRNKLRSELYEAGKEDYYYFQGMSHHHPNGESLYDVEWRVKTFLERDILGNDWGTDHKRIAVISHGMTIKCLLHLILQFDHKMAWRIDIDNTSVSSLNFKNNLWRIKSINSTNHL